MEINIKGWNDNEKNPGFLIQIDTYSVYRTNACSINELDKLSRLVENEKSPLAEKIKNIIFAEKEFRSNPLLW